MKKYFLIGTFSGLLLAVGYFFLVIQEKQEVPNVTVTGNSVSEACPDYELSCVRSALKEMTKNDGPEPALAILTALTERGLLPANDDFHQVAHEIGRKTADVFGSNGPAFLKCPTTYNYGCQHGFFEHVLGRSASAVEAINTICGEIEKDPQYSDKFKFYCYHGVGHGLLMARANDITLALATCDSLPTSTGAEGCYQGVFMENTNAGMKNEAREGTFSNVDPLAPCNGDLIEERHRSQCYINHAGSLMQFFGNDIVRASASCLSAGNFTRICMESIGLMVTNPGWQVALAAPLGLNGEADKEKLALELCMKFPADWRGACIIAGLDNIMNFDEADMGRAGTFCGLSREIECFQRIGSNLRNQIVDISKIQNACENFEPEHRNACLTGAQLKTQ